MESQCVFNVPWRGFVPVTSVHTAECGNVSVARITQKSTTFLACELAVSVFNYHTKGTQTMVD